MKSSSKEDSQSWWDGLNHFSPDEFDSPDKPGSGRVMMDKDFMLKLDKARDIARIKFNINSGYRTVDHNRRVGGVSDSPHLSGHAADIDANNSRERFIVVQALVQAGFTRIGISAKTRGTFVHVDDDPSKTEELLWIY